MNRFMLISMLATLLLAEAPTDSIPRLLQNEAQVKLIRLKKYSPDWRGSRIGVVNLAGDTLIGVFKGLSADALLIDVDATSREVQIPDLDHVIIYPGRMEWGLIMGLAVIGAGMGMGAALVLEDNDSSETQFLAAFLGAGIGSWIGIRLFLEPEVVHLE